MRLALLIDLNKELEVNVNIGNLLTRRAALNPEREAYIDSSSDQRLPFSELNNRSNQIANQLLAMGIEKGERVALALMNRAEFIQAYEGIAKIGGIVVFPKAKFLNASSMIGISCSLSSTHFFISSEFNKIVMK